MNVQTISVKCPFKQECEDALAIHESLGLYGVLDGVTPMHDFVDAEGHNAGYLAANIVKRRMESASSIRSVKDTLIEANSDVREAMLTHNVDLSIKYELWSTCAAIVRIGETAVDFAHLGDCMIVTRTRSDGRWKAQTVDRVRGVSERAKLKREADRAKGVELPPESFYAELRERMKYNRTMANSEGGYGVVNGMPEASDYIQYGQLAKEELTHIVLMSDGMFFPERSVEESAELMVKHGLPEYVRLLEDTETRLQLRPDDKTAIVIVL